MLIHEIEIPAYPSKIMLSKKRNPKYHEYSKRSALPKKYKTVQYEWRGRYLYDTETDERVIKNSRSVGTPRYWSVNFQAIWNQQIKYQARANII